MLRITGIALLAAGPTGCLSTNLRNLATITSGELVQHATGAAQPMAHRQLDSQSNTSSDSSSDSSSGSDFDDDAYLGCYLDEPDGALLEYAFHSADMTLEMCYTECRDKDATYMGLKYGFLCSCGFDDENDYTIYGTGECPYYCNGSGEENCGGTSSFDLYSVESGINRPGTPSTMSPTSSPISTASDDASRPWRPWRPTFSPSSSSTSSPTTVTMSDDGRFATVAPAPSKPAPVTPAPRPTRAPTTPVAPTAAPVTPEVPPSPTPVLTTEQPVDSTSTTSTSDGSSTPTDMVELLDLHNEARCVHNASPLTWSDTVASSAALHAETLVASCGELFHSTDEDRNYYGENLFMCWGSDSCYSPGGAMQSLYNEEVAFDTVAEYGGHATQILWKSSKELGCVLAECSKAGDPHTILVCQYDPAGNNYNDLDVEVELPSASGSC